MAAIQKLSIPITLVLISRFEILVRIGSRVEGPPVEIEFPY
jgi:hypothetical protein